MSKKKPEMDDSKQKRSSHIRCQKKIPEMDDSKQKRSSQTIVIETAARTI
jgi:hypothetical protein